MIYSSSTTIVHLFIYPSGQPSSQPSIYQSIYLSTLSYLVSSYLILSYYIHISVILYPSIDILPLLSVVCCFAFCIWVPSRTTDASCANRDAQFQVRCPIIIPWKSAEPRSNISADDSDLHAGCIWLLLSCLKLLKVAYLPVVGKFRAKPNSIHHRYDRPLFCSTKVRKWFLPLSCLATFGHHWLDTPSIYARRAWFWSALLWVHNNNNHIIDIYYIYIYYMIYILLIYIDR